MKYHSIIVSFLFLVPCQISWGQTINPYYKDGQLFIKLKDSVTDTLSIKSDAILPLVPVYDITGFRRPFTQLDNDTLDRVYKVNFSNIGLTQSLMDTLQTLPVVDFVERVPLRKLAFTPNDPDSNGQYFLKKIQAREAWNITQGSPNIIVAVVDNSVLTSHQDLQANLVPGYDVADNDNNPNPPPGAICGSFPCVEWGHGTHCAGDVSAVTNNDIGVSGIGFNTKVMPVKSTHDTSSADVIDMPDEGIAYAMTHGANVISLSWGGPGTAVCEQVLINAALGKGVVIVAAAGNNDSILWYYPASYKGVICVGSTDSTDIISPFSNYGPQIDVMAPGNQIFSTFAYNDSSYREFTGTSMSTPIVAGLCALVLAVHPDYTPAQVKAAIIAGCDDISAENPGYAGMLGAGRINAFRTLGGTETAIPGLPAGETVKFFPNPFATNLHVSINEEALPAIIELTDVNGQLVLTQEITSGFFNEIPAGQLQNGMYLMRVITPNGVTTAKVVKM